MEISDNECFIKPKMQFAKEERMKRIKSIIVMMLSLCLIMGLFPDYVFATGKIQKEYEEDDDIYDGDEDDDETMDDIGLEDVDISSHLTEVPKGYTAINSIDDLYAVRNDVTKNYILMSDIDMSSATAAGGSFDMGNGWKPIDDFKGTFNGNGYRIIGMHIFGDMKGKNTGLFGKATGNIVNLGLKECNINVKNTQNVGAIAGKYEGWLGEPVTMFGCFATGNIKVEETDTIDSYYVGGLVGSAGGNDTVQVYDCYNVANITIKKGKNEYGDKYYIVGGLIGWSDALHMRCKDCYNYGTIDDRDGYGICGSSSEYSRSFTNCYYFANGARSGHGDFADSINEENTKIKITSLNNENQFRNKVFFSGFDFEKIWDIDAYCAEYPYPQLRGNLQVMATDLRITKNPSKLEYSQGEPIDFSDGEVEITYENGTKTVIGMNCLSVEGYDINEIGRQKVILSYAGCETEIYIDVKRIELTDLALDQTEMSLNVSESKKLTAILNPENATDRTLSWESAKESVATVDSDGTVHAKNKGETIVTVYSKDKQKSASCKVTVKVPCVKMTSNEYINNMCLGESQKLAYVMQPMETTDNVVWSSSNSEVAAVDEHGKVTAVSNGKVNIVATADSGVSAKYAITVKDVNNIKVTISTVKIQNRNNARIKLGGKNIKQADGYQIMVSQKGGKSYKKTIGKVSTYKINKLKRRKKYTIKIRSYMYSELNDNTYYGSWSAKKTFKTR